MKYRNEIKFTISKNIAEILKQRLSLLLKIDENSTQADNSYYIRSLYFDDDNSSAYYEKIDGIEFRKKYRIRIYNNDYSFIRLECKYKHENMTSKEQVLIDRDICDKIIYGKLSEIDTKDNKLLEKFLVDFKTQKLKPSIIVDYNRLAYIYHVSEVRITFDSKIKSGLYNYNLYDSEALTCSVIDDEDVVLEVKFNEILPEPIAIILSTVPMIRQAYSKFAACRSIK